MDNLDKLIENMSIDNKDEIILKTFEPFALTLYALNKEAKKERDALKEIIHNESVEKSRTDVIHSMFKIKNSSINGNILKTMDVEFDLDDPKGVDDVLIDKLLEKFKHPFFYASTMKAMYSAGLITEDLKTDYIKEVINFMNTYYTDKHSWKENIDKLPECKIEDIREIFIASKKYFKPFVESKEKEECLKRKDDLYIKKDIFLHLLKEHGLKATEMHYFLTPYGNVFNELPYITYGGYGFHTKDFSFVEDKEKLKKGYIEGEISSESKVSLGASEANILLGKAVKLLSDYRDNKISFDELIKETNLIIDNSKDLKEHQEKLIEIDKESNQER